VEVIGVVESALPLPAIPKVEPGDFIALAPGAAAIAVIGFAETSQVAQRFADEHRYDVRQNQELLALGGSNILSGAFQGFIVGGGASQSAANDSAGARTALVSLIVAGLALLTSVALLPLFRDLPQAVLGAIVISAVIGFLRVAEIRRIGTLRRDSLAAALFALVATLVLGILPGLITAVLLALLLLLVRIARPGVAIVPEAELQAAGLPGSAPSAGPHVLRLEAPLLFLNAGRLRDQVRDHVRAADPKPDVVIVDLRMSDDLDIESLDIVSGMADQLREQGIELWIAGLGGHGREVLGRAGIGPEGPPFRWFVSLREALAAASTPGTAGSGR
jgi:MFS superfamily sulfate permease-like transporter